MNLPAQNISGLVLGQIGGFNVDFKIDEMTEVHSLESH